MLQYPESDAGRQLVDSTTLERANPYARILGSVQTGILVFFAGIALLAVRSSTPGSAANGADDRRRVGGGGGWGACSGGRRRHAGDGRGGLPRLLRRDRAAALGVP